jgi:hypothetical protein
VGCRLSLCGIWGGRGRWGVKGERIVVLGWVGIRSVLFLCLDFAEVIGGCRIGFLKPLGVV